MPFYLLFLHAVLYPCIGFLFSLLLAVNQAIYGQLLAELLLPAVNYQPLAELSEGLLSTTSILITLLLGYRSVSSRHMSLTRKVQGQFHT